MSMINYASREINCKIVYYGTGLGGKTTNLEYIYSKVNPDTKGKMISLATETERTLFFDFLPIDLGEVRGFKTRFHLYTGRSDPRADPRWQPRLRRRADAVGRVRRISVSGAGSPRPPATRS